MKKEMIRIKGMSCDKCVKAITSAVSGLDGVAGIQVRLQTRSAILEYDPGQISLDTVKAEIVKLGYEVA